jgi:phage terminase large subunit GpA-like protein
MNDVHVVTMVHISQRFKEHEFEQLLDEGYFDKTAYDILDHLRVPATITTVHNSTLNRKYKKIKEASISKENSIKYLD